MPEPEIIPPDKTPQRGGKITDEQLDYLAGLLDDIFRIPGTGIRFGLDPLLGLVPGLGDALSGLVSLLLVYSGWQRRLPRVTLARMVANIAIDTLVGTVPVLGDAFDVAWKANRKNYQLLARTRTRSGRAQSWRDWLFLAGLVAMVVALLAAPIIVLVWAIAWFTR
jgi:hypothetical protein